MAASLPNLTMLASTADPFDSDMFLFEPKWDGFRCLAYVEKNMTKLQSRNGNDLTPHFPELSALHREIAITPAIIDGEIIAFHGGRELFHPLLTRIRAEPRANMRPVDVSILFVAFDLLYSRGRSILHIPLQERKVLLSESVAGNEYLVVNGYVHQSGVALFQAAVAQGREGIMAKRLGSPYQPGKRTRLWLKIKPLKTVEAVVIGYVPKTKNTFASLALGQYLGKNQLLVYVGNVGTGFTEAQMGEILAGLTPLPPNEKPVVQELPHDHSSIIWVRPEIVVEIGYLEYTPSGNLRHPTYQRRREDIDPKQCIFPDTDQP